MTYSQEYLDTLTKEQRGEIWIQSVLAKEPDYNVQELKDIWKQTQNTHETYEQEADKIKWLDKKIEASLNSERIVYDNLDDLFDDIEKEAFEMLQDKYRQKQIA